MLRTIAGWSSLVARRAHNPKVRGSNPLPATKEYQGFAEMQALLFFWKPLCTGNLARKVPDSIIRPYERLIHEWYRQYPFLQAMQVHEILKGYGFTGGEAPQRAAGPDQVS